jgi:2-polyprenyl-3-methyl-5-hydroxy-6-metoxy-1,4-benzoquinol methylase
MNVHPIGTAAPTPVVDPGSTTIPGCWHCPEAGQSSIGDDQGWPAYWEGLDELKTFRIEAEDYLRRLEKYVDIQSTWRVLDFGCGFGQPALLLSKRAASVAVWDASHNVRTRAFHNLRHVRNIEFLDLRNKEALQSAGQFDLILVHSVVQYMNRRELGEWLVAWSSALSAANGRIIVSDIVVPGNRLFRDVLALLSFSLRKHFVREVLVEGAREMRRYTRTRGGHPLQLLTRQDIGQMADDAALTVEISKHNLSYRPGRLTAMFHRGLIGM